MGPSLNGFAPIVGQDARLLILGNAPSVMSLAAGQYYGNPRNSFWRVMDAVFGVDAEAPYTARVAGLTSAGVAVWDVLLSCRRVGSLDSAVELDSMVANDFRAFFGAHTSIGRVYFNGAAAEANYRRLVGSDAPVTYRRLPSTSPAHTVPFSAKLAAWRQIAY